MARLIGRTRLLVGVPALLAGVSQPALAQDRPAPATPKVAAETPATDGFGQPDIVVTAQRREQRLQDAPVAVTALSDGALAQFNVSNAQDLMQVVPSLQVSTQTAGNGSGSATFFLRGLGQQRSGNGSEPAVGIYVDDFYYPSLSGTLFNIVDLAQVEVLRGPQGTLFGRNTIGGAIRYTTRGATLGEFEGHLTGTVGSFDRYEVSGGINVPIGSFAALRLTGGHLQRDGYVRVQTGGDDAGATGTDLIRGQLRVEPTAQLSVDLSAQWSRDKLSGLTYNQPGPLTPAPPAPGGQPSLPFIYNLAIAPRIGAPSYTDALRSTCFYCQAGTGRPEFSRTTYKNALATIGWDFTPGFTLKSLTGWQDVENESSYDLDGTIAPIVDIGIQNQRTFAFSQEVQLNGKLLRDRLNFVAGAFYYNERNRPVRTITPDIFLGAPMVLVQPDERQVRSYAGYIDAAATVTDRLKLLGGYRHSVDKKTVTTFAATTGAALAQGGREFDSSTYRVGLQYRWTPDVMSYATIATGFRAGGFNPYDPLQNPTQQPFSPETSTSYEAGLRMQFLDRRVTLNPTAFYVDWSKIQVQKVVVNNATGATSVVLQNAGAARSYGLELEWSVQPTGAVRLFGTFAFLDIRYTDVGQATGITVNTELQRAPPITFSLGASHTLDLSAGSVVSTVNFSFEDDQYSTPTLADRLLLPGYGLLGARIEFTPRSKVFSIGVFATNLTDRRYYVGGVNYTRTAGSPHYDVGRPREIGATARVRF